ncbi:Hsp70 family protein [Mycobacterium sp. RTGN4]|uniref:Hsp70 family protein n=1 Tax=Mycobacterium sp. RTGN4 TaxID=3016523 RepID=UPI0029C688AA|nr:Hsp70 family protein [Mycobacterium sp. RTGN4]
MGATHLVAARADGSATVRPAAVAWRGDVLKGFVERIGDPVPIVASDGSAHSAQRLLSHALSDLVNAAGGPREGMSIAIPAHWPEHVVARFRAVAPDVPVVTDATAALTALRANPGLPARGVVMLCDFGASGTNITLVDAGRAFQPIGPTTRYDDFSGELIDRYVLTHLLDDADVDPARTSAIASLTGFREHCRTAKERLSHQTATGLPGLVPGSTVRLTRTELEALLQGPLDGLLDAIDDTLRRAGVLPSNLAAVATVGGGARIPIVTQWLSQALRMPVTTTPDAQTVAAIGAALLASREPESATRVVAAPQTGTLLAAAVPALAWSQESVVDDPVLELDWQDEQWARPEVEYEPHQDDEAAPTLPWYQASRAAVRRSRVCRGARLGGPCRQHQHRYGECLCVRAAGRCAARDVPGSAAECGRGGPVDGRHPDGRRERRAECRHLHAGGTGLAGARAERSRACPAGSAARSRGAAACSRGAAACSRDDDTDYYVDDSHHYVDDAHYYVDQYTHLDFDFDADINLDSHVGKYDDADHFVGSARRRR